MADLLVTIGTDATNFNRGMQQVAQTAQSTANSVTQSAGRINTSITQTGRQVQAGTNQAAFALTNLGRVAQDAPYGFIGIQNNLNPLLESFQRLRAETGSNGTAIRSLIGAFAGPAGLGVALSLVTAGITFFIQSQQAANKVQKEAKDASEKYVESATEEISKLQTLYSASQNTALSQQGRLNAVNALQKQYPSYFKNLSDEAILVGNAKDAYDKLTQVIIGKAAISAAQEQLQTALKPLVERTIKLAQANLNTPDVDVRKVLSDLQKNVDDNKSGLIIPIDSFKLSNQNRRDATAPIMSDAQKAAIQSDQIREQQEASAKKWQDTIQSLIKKFGTETIDEGSKKTLSGFDIIEDQIRKLTSDLETATIKGDIPLISNLAAQLKTAEAQLDIFKEKFDDAISKVPTFGKQIDISTPLPRINTPQTAGTDDATISGMQDYAQKVGEATNQIYAYHAARKETQKDDEREKKNLSAITNLIGGGLVNAFQSALEGTQSFVSAMGQFIAQLIERLVAAAIAAAALAALLSFTGLGGILGISSSAGSFSSLFSSLSGLKLAQGGITTGPTRALIGEGSEPEAVMPLSKLGQFVNSNGGGGAVYIEPFMVGPNLWYKQKVRAEKTIGRTG